MVARRNGVTFAAWRGKDFVPLIEVLLVVGRWIRQAHWRLRNAEFATGFRSSDELNVMSSQVNLIPTSTLIDLVSDGVEMIGGDLTAFREPGEDPFLVVRSVRGDEWDIESDDPYLLRAVKDSFDAAELSS